VVVRKISALLVVPACGILDNCLVAGLHLNCVRLLRVVVVDPAGMNPETRLTGRNAADSSTARLPPGFLILACSTAECQISAPLISLK